MGNSKFDELLSQLGTGKWNLLYFISASLWFFLIPPQGLSGTYLAPNVDFKCRPPEHLNATVSEDYCWYRVNTSSVVEDRPCTQWDYDTSTFSTTLTSEFNLVCDRAYLRATFQSIQMFGTFISPIIGGYLADRFGRKMVVVGSLSIFTLMGVCISFLNNFTAILVCRFMLGFVNLPTYYILAMEVCEMRLRSFVGILTALPWAFGTMAWGAMAFMIRDWRPLQLVVSLPNLLIFPALYFMDESPRWLITNGQHERALQVLKKAARWNKKQLPPDEELRTIMKDIEEESSSLTEKKMNGAATDNSKSRFGRLLQKPVLCSTRRITLISVIMSVDYLVVAMVFYGLNLNATNFSADPFVYMILAGLMEIPAYSITAPIIQKLGRKKPTVCGYIVSGVSILALAFIPSDISWLVMSLAMLGKMMISAAYQIIYVYVNELFPTVVRVKGMGSAIVASRVGSILSPYITDYLGPHVPWMPSLIFGGASLVAGFVTILLPETLGVPLPDTIKDLEDKKPQRKECTTTGDVEEKEKFNLTP